MSSLVTLDSTSETDVPASPAPTCAPYQRLPELLPPIPHMKSEFQHFLRSKLSNAEYQAIIEKTGPYYVFKICAAVRFPSRDIDFMSISNESINETLAQRNTPERKFTNEFEDIRECQYALRYIINTLVRDLGSDSKGVLNPPGDLEIRLKCREQLSRGPVSDTANMWSDTVVHRVPINLKDSQNRPKVMSLSGTPEELQEKLQSLNFSAEDIKKALDEALEKFT